MVAALVVAAALWGAAASGTKFALRGFAPLTLLAVELAAATAVLWLVVVLTGRRARPDWRLAIALGVLEPALAYVGDTVGLARTSASNAVIINGLESTFVVLLAAAVQRRRPSARLTVSVVVGLVGLLVLEHVDELTTPRSGDALVLAGTVCAAAYSLVAATIDPGVDCLVLTAAQFSIATVLVAPVAVIAWTAGGEAMPTGVAPQYWVAAALVGAAGFAASFVLYNTAAGTADPRTAAVVVNLIAPFGLLVAVLWLDESLTAPQVFGAALIVASVATFTRAELRPHPESISTSQEGMTSCR